MAQIIINVEDNFLISFIEKLKEFVKENEIDEKDILIDNLTISEFETVITSG